MDLEDLIFLLISRDNRMIALEEKGEVKCVLKNLDLGNQSTSGLGSVRNDWRLYVYIRNKRKLDVKWPKKNGWTDDEYQTMYQIGRLARFRQKHCSRF